ncbi:MAG TPA: hypothetical protein VED59_07260 [Acidimicrobiales bacterium]|nr:hypothetical protein [Acidimicrobiales bacterium]
MPSSSAPGYGMVTDAGSVATFGGLAYNGSLGVKLVHPVVAVEMDPVSSSYWLAATDGRVFPFGGAGDYGSLGQVDTHLVQRIVDMQANWDDGSWRIQVQETGGQVPLAAAATVASWRAGDDLPPATAGLIWISLAGNIRTAPIATSGLVLWAQGSDVYQVRAPGSDVAALNIAADMRPWPEG